MANEKSTPRNTITVYGNGSTPYIIKGNDDYIKVNTAGGSIAIFVPNILGAGLNNSVKRFYIVDASGTASTNSITIYASSGNLINGASHIVLDVDNITAELLIVNNMEWQANLSGDTGGAPGTVAYGAITGNPTAQTNLQNATLQSGTFTPVNSAIALGDTFRVALEKAQGQINAGWKLSGNALAGPSLLGSDSGNYGILFTPTGGAQGTIDISANDAITLMTTAAQMYLTATSGNDITLTTEGAGRVRLSNTIWSGTLGLDRLTNTKSWQMPNIDGTFALEINVLNYGADPLGISNSTAAFSAAKTAAGVNGIIIVPAGTYLTDSITLSLAGQTWVFQKGSIVKINAGSTTSLFVISAANITLTGEGILDGNYTNIVSAGVAGVYTSSSSSTGLLVYGITIQNTYGYGLQSLASNTTLDSCKFINCGTNNASAVIVATSGSDITDITLDNILVDNSAMNAATYNTGIVYVTGAPRSGTVYTNNVNRAKVTNCTIIGPTNPASLTGSVVCLTIGSQNTTVSNNVLIGGSMGVSIDAGNYCVFSSNTIKGPKWYAIEIVNSSNCTVSNNTINGNALTGIGLIDTGGSGTAVISSTNSGTCTNNIISGNVIKNFYNAGCNAISLNNGSNISVINNDITCTGTVGGIVATISKTKISDNTINGDGTGGVNAIKLFNTVGISVIADNEIINWSTGINLNANTAITIDNVSISGNTMSTVSTPVSNTLSGGAILGTSIKIVGNSGSTDYTDYKNLTLYGNALTSGTLAQFAATTSAQLAGVISDETGFSSGAVLVFNKQPTFVTDITAPIVYGSAASGGNLQLNSTSHATKGKILFGAGSAFDETLGFWGIGTQSPAGLINLSGSISAAAWTTSGIRIRGASQTFTDTTSSAGTVANVYFDVFGVATLNSTNVVTYTNAIGSYFMSPGYGTGGGSITNTYSLGTQGNIQIGGSTIQMSNSGANSTLQIPNASGSFRIQTGGSNTVRFTIAATSGLIGIGPTAPTPTAYLTLAAGVSTASAGAPLKFTSGTNLATAEAGAMEYNGTDLFFTKSGTTRGNVLVATAVTTEAVLSDTTLTITYNGTTYKVLARA